MQAVLAAVVARSGQTPENMLSFLGVRGDHPHDDSRVLYATDHLNPRP